MSLRFGSVCSGIEAASVAFKPLGWEAAWFSEIEKFPSTVLAHHYPQVKNLGDMTKIAKAILLGEVEAPDMLCGGTPCQAFSVAGLRQSLADDRGNLSLKFVELADAIDHVRGMRGKQPAVVFWENVPGVLSTKDNAFGCFLAGLAGEDEPLIPPGGKWANAGAVYGPQRAIAWRTLDAQYFGLAQRRRRVFVVASARDGFDPAQVLFEWDGVRRDSSPSREAGQEAARCLTRGSGGGQRYDGETETFVTHSLRGEGFDASEDGTGRGTPLVPVAHVDVLPTMTAGPSTEAGHNARSGHCKDGYIVPMAHAFDARQSDVCQYGDKTGPLDTDGHTIGVLHASAYEADAASVLSALRSEVGAEAVAEWGSRILDSLQSPEVLQSWLHGGSIRRAPSDFRSIVEHCPLPRKEGMPARALLQVWEHGPDGRSPQGRGLAKQLAYELGEALSELPHAGTFSAETMRRLRASSEGARAMRQALSAVQEMGRPTCDEAQSAQPPLQVRRLTAVECERLMGFPDGYTAIPWRGKPASECPDGPRYKALGNSWAVPCVRWIGARIQKQLGAETLLEAA